MRIESVVIENINSLSGRFEIDFTSSEYSEGLFAIVGPSGAGKSTVLDAVCLALYGRTPRITVSTEHNEAMNREAQGCSAEVVFTSGEKRYRSTFSHRKTKRSAKPFMQPKNELWEVIADSSQKALADKSTQARQKVEKIIGLDYDQFTRSVLLAQFRFAEFLKAKPNERAAILEQVSGTDIYRRISIAVYQKQKSYSEELSEISIRKEGIRVLSKEEKQIIENRLAAIGGRIEGYEALASSISESITKTEESNRQSKALSGFEADRQAISKALMNTEEVFDAAGKAFIKQKEKAAELNKTLVKVRELDLHIAAANKEALRLRSEIETADKNILSQKKAILAILKKHLPAAGNDELKWLYEADNETQIISERISSRLNETELKQKAFKDEQLKLLGGKDEKLLNDEIKAFEAALPVLKAKKEIEAANEEMSRLKAKYSELQTQEKHLKELAAQNDEKFLFVKLQEKYADERSKLEDGKPCPLCGAAHHPGAQHEFDSSFAAAVGEEKNQLEEKLKKAKSEITEIEFNVRNSAKTIAQNEDITKNSSVPKKIAALKEKELKKGLENNKKLLDESRSLNEQISKLSADILALTKQLGEVEKDVSEIKHSKAVIKDTEKRKTDLEKQSAEAQSSKQKLAQKRHSVFGDRNADAEEKRQAGELKQAEDNKEKARRSLEEAKKKQAANAADIKRTSQRLEELAKIIKASFAYINEKAQAVKAMQADEQDEPHTQIINQIDSMGENTESMAQLKSGLSGVTTQLRERIGESRKTLSISEENEKKLKDLVKHEKQTQALFKKWSDLNGLIGSADGSKFSRIAQGITFDVLLSFANESLKKMSDRYILIRDESSGANPLGINVADNYQAGDIRPVSNLSGGESFVVSLALALGLSEMSSGRTLIDSLFIDEGFASLDENYLELALQTLSTLGNRQNKLIGVISHVKELKERIDTQIEVTPLSGGRSTLKGPGVSVN